MVYNSKTLEVLHPLTEDGKQKYEKMLESAADELLYRSHHPIKWLIGKIKQSFCM